MKLIRLIVRYLTAWAWAQEVNSLEGMTKITELHAKGGNHLELHVTQNPGMAAYMGHCFASMISQSVNYTEMSFDVRDPKSIYKRIAVTIKKHNGLSPHELRMQADKSADEARAALAAAGRPCDTCGGRFPNLDPEAECPRCFAEDETQRANISKEYYMGRIKTPAETELVDACLAETQAAQKDEYTAIHLAQRRHTFAEAVRTERLLTQ